MPHVQITTLGGKTQEQKRTIVKRITEVMVEEAGVPPEMVTVAILDVSPDNYAIGGDLITDVIKRKKG
jgi:4-oxalocrotonate tautomerase